MLHVLEQNQNDDNLSFISYFNLTFTANPDNKQYNLFLMYQNTWREIFIELQEDFYRNYN